MCILCTPTALVVHTNTWTKNFSLFVLSATGLAWFLWRETKSIRVLWLENERSEEKDSWKSRPNLGFWGGGHPPVACIYFKTILAEEKGGGGVFILGLLMSFLRNFQKVTSAFCHFFIIISFISYLHAYVNLIHSTSTIQQFNLVSW